MSRVKDLLQSYGRHIALPWRKDAAAPQRVIFCVYNEQDELRLRAVFPEFEMATREAAHGWVQFDLSDTFSRWLSGQKYAKRYYEKPNLLPTLLPRYESFIESEFTSFLQAHQVDQNTVVAVSGVGSLFGLLKVREVVDKLAPQVTGRLLLFFPGSYEANNYRLLDGYDGWNYLAVPITADSKD